MIGCLLLIPIGGFLTFMGVYMASMMAFFGALGTAMGVVMAGIASFLTAFFVIMFG
jgi:hypothetical protein